MSKILMLNQVPMKRSVVVFLIMRDLVTKMPNAARRLVQIKFASLVVKCCDDFCLKFEIPCHFPMRNKFIF